MSLVGYQTQGIDCTLPDRGQQDFAPGQEIYLAHAV
jgi:hypothetical protein